MLQPYPLQYNMYTTSSCQKLSLKNVTGFTSFLIDGIKSFINIIWSDPSISLIESISGHFVLQDMYACVIYNQVALTVHG